VKNHRFFVFTDYTNRSPFFLSTPIYYIDAVFWIIWISVHRQGENFRCVFARFYTRKFVLKWRAFLRVEIANFLGVEIQPLKCLRSFLNYPLFWGERNRFLARFMRPKLRLRVCGFDIARVFVVEIVFRVKWRSFLISRVFYNSGSVL